MHSRWLKTRRHFYESLRQEIQMITGPLGEELELYQQEYEKTFEPVWDVGSMEQLMEKLVASHIVLAGDFHYFYQSQRTHLRILRDLKKLLLKTASSKELAIGLEIFDVKDQKKLDAFLQGQLSLDELLKKTKWHKKWNNMPTKGYEVLLLWAKSANVKVFGVNDSSLDSLEQRDFASAKAIDHLSAENPGHILYVIYGDFHLAANHLPAKMTSFQAQRDVILYLNSDKLYFELSEHAVEDQFDVLRYHHLFCILSSTPWVKLQSYLVFLQEMDDQMISEVDDDDDFEPDYTDYVGRILDIYASDFDLPDWKKFLDILTPNDLAFEKLGFLKLSKEDKQKLAYFVTAQKNIVFPKDQTQFLAKPSVNNAYSLVGEFIHCHLSQRESLNWSGLKFMPQRIWIEAVCFFFNLWLNPNVKSLNESDLTPHLRSLEPEAIGPMGSKSQDYAEAVLRFAVDYKLSELEKSMHANDRPMVKEDIAWTIQLEAAGLLGKILGKKLYKTFKSGNLSKEMLMSYLSVPLESEKFEPMYAHILQRLEK